MAKQSGLHQIRGKVGEHSYYRQTGVSSGLIRSINPGMSSRVKTAEEYANTRLNNAEFGAAANVAGLLGQMVTPKFRPMILPFSQSKMAKEILKLARQNSDDWGQRTVASSQTSQLCSILSSMSKQDVSEFCTISIDRGSATAGDVVTSFSADQLSLMMSLGIDHLTINVKIIDLATGNYNAVVDEMATGYFNVIDRIVAFDDTIDAATPASTTESFVTDAFIPAPNHSAHQIAVAVVIPQRSVNGTYYTLQEYCRFIALPQPAVA